MFAVSCAGKGIPLAGPLNPWAFHGRLGVRGVGVVGVVGA